jgi:hypothetical protein
LSTSPALADRLAPRIDGEGLAWLGPDALRRLATHGCTADVRESAARWVASFGERFGEGAAP